jgi:cob(I)alamin adenosyltransferase
MVQYAQEHGISAATREYRTTRVTVRKWLRRYEQKRLQGLMELSRKPHRCPHRMRAKQEARVVELRVKHPKWGAWRLQDRYGLNVSTGAIERVIRQHGLVRSKRRRYRKRRDLSALKKRLQPFQSAQVDTKDLSDILQYWPIMKRLGLPRYEYTYRDKATGAAFFAYADRNNSTYAAIFARYVLNHLRSYGVDTAQVSWQSDNGSEYVGSTQKKTNRPSAFEKILSAYRVHHRRIPPRASYLQGDVETFHLLVEEELYDLESYDNPMEFLGKAYAYQLYFNSFRKNRYREKKTPLDLLRQQGPALDTRILNLPPIRLESLLDSHLKTGYHVPGLALRACSRLLTGVKAFAKLKIVMPANARRGLTIIYTGDGKGKTSAALGAVFRALGHGWHVLVVQFFKGDWPVVFGEVELSKRLVPEMELLQLGKGFVSYMGDVKPFDTHVDAAKEALQLAKSRMNSGEYDLVVLDEIIYAIDYAGVKLIEESEVLDLLDLKPPNVHVILTGRNASQTLINRADLVTEMHEVKHPWQKKIPAQIGIDY